MKDVQLIQKIIQEREGFLAGECLQVVWGRYWIKARAKHAICLHATCYLLYYWIHSSIKMLCAADNSSLTIGGVHPCTRLLEFNYLMIIEDTTE